MIRILPVLILLSLPLLAQSSEPQPQSASPDLRAWKWSIVAMAGAHTADVVSSWPSRPGVEANPLFRRSDGELAVGRAIAVKAGVTVGAALLQRWVIRRLPPQSKAARMFATVNFSVAVGVGAVAARNWRIQ